MRYALLGSLLLLLAAAARADSVQLHPQAVVSGSEITLGDVAELEGPAAQALRSLVVGRIPAGAAEVAVQFDTVQRHLDAAAVNLSTLTVKGARSCRVAAAGGGWAATPDPTPAPLPAPVVVLDPVPHGDPTVSERIADELYRLTGAASGSLDIAFRGNADAAAWLNAAAPRGVVEITAQSRTGLGRVPVRVRRFADDGTVSETTLTADVVLRVQAVVVTAPIRRGERFTAQNVAVERVALDSDRGTPVTELDMLLGQAASASLRVGSPVLAEHLQPDVLVKRGDLVTVSVRRGRLMIRTVGRAAEDGARGAIISLRNDATREHFYATVTGPRTAAIDDAAPTAPASDWN